MTIRQDSEPFLSLRVDAHLADGPVACRSLRSDAYLAKRSSRVRRHSIALRSRSAHSIEARFRAQRRESHLTTRNSLRRYDARLLTTGAT